SVLIKKPPILSGASLLTLLSARRLHRVGVYSAPSVLILSFSFLTLRPLHILTSCFSQCTASSASHNPSSASFAVFRISSSSHPHCCSYVLRQLWLRPRRTLLLREVLPVQSLQRTFRPCR